MPQRNIALYVSSSAVTPELRAQIQQNFDTAPSAGGTSHRPGYIELVPDSDGWSVGMSPENIHRKHSEDYVPRYPRKPVVIMDERTAQDRSVLVVAPILDADTDQFKHMELRFVPSRVPDAAMNLEIGNQTLEEYASHVDEDGIFRWFKGSTVPNPDA
ncbi:hypothetical protein D9758_016839 [Tetrapyrgos nigripes]|uniref:DUF6924 domain-containing protein n=1 Tax=Tetrapyrgos nigripes TaxID=182062 RepID=A0A8H5CAK1_9AGAR|nr:hypothetical protein D9758_016839 [Tetrapyrgos nigripes]